MIVRRTHPAEILEICGRLRQSDHDELLATSFFDDVVLQGELIASGLERAVLAYTFCGDDGRPIAFVGGWLIAPGVATASMFATDELATIGRPAFLFCRDRLFRDAVPRAFRRVECRALASNTVARAWMKRLGFAEEGLCRALGKGGEDFVSCAWVHPSHPKEA